MIKRTSLLVCVWGTLLLCSCGSTYKLTMSDAGFPLLAGTPLDVLQQENIVYMHTGSDRFDSFFKQSATLYGSFVVGKHLTGDVTKNLKGYARSRVAKGQLSDNAKEFLNGRDPDSLSAKETAALLQLDKKQHQMTGEETVYMTKALLNLGGAALAMGKATTSSVELIKTGTDLMGNIKDEMSIFGVPKFWIIRGVMTGTKTSLKELKEVKDEAPALAKEIAVLTEGVKLLTQKDEAAAPTDSTAAPQK
jgi:hypothetical protein